ncbi:MAG: PGF-pre-PGF domain-containing protein [ANME-2 cluster archaeon]|nr:PGF-pre-PGF domain-containing protein [ANME-2 cluster archaeon]
MTKINVKVNEILTNPLVRNVLHLISTILLGYIVLRLLLYILGTTHIGLGWLEANQGSDFFVIILILIFSLLIIDAGISLGRRRMGDMKYSVAESGISLARVGIQRLRVLPGIMKEKAAMIASSGPKRSSPSGKSRQKEPTIKELPTPDRIEPAPMNKAKKASKPILEKEPVTTKVPEPTRPIIKKPTSLEEAIKKPAPYKEPKSNIKFSDSVPILVKEGKRVIKAFDSEHSINVIDFRSGITKKDVKITIELLKEHSYKAESIKDGLVYEFDTISVDIPDEYIENAVIRFKINRDWITNHKIRTVQVEQFIYNNWAIMPTKRIGQDAKYLFYEVYVPSFSVPFAIVGV